MQDIVSLNEKRKRCTMSAGSRIKQLYRRYVTGAVSGETVTLGDHDHELRVVLDPGLPDDAYRRLFHLDLALCGSDVLTWDYSSGDWRPM